MKRTTVIPVVLLALALVLSACSPNAASAGSAPASAYGAPAATQPPAATQASSSSGSSSGSSSAAMPSGPAQIALGKTSQFSSFIADNKGMSLYLYTKDSPNTSNCYGKCATAWPPLLTSGAPVGGSGLDASKLGTTTRTDGTVQVTYNGWPLYYFAKDKQPGDTTGQNVGSVWFLVSPTGDAVK